MGYNRQQTSLFWVVVAMVEAGAGNRAGSESGWSVDRTTANAGMRDKVGSYQNGVRVEKDKVVEPSPQRIRTMKWYWPNGRR